MNHNHIAIVPAANNHFWHIKFAMSNKSSFYFNFIETLSKWRDKLNDPCSRTSNNISCSRQSPRLDTTLLLSVITSEIVLNYSPFVSSGSLSELVYNIRHKKDTLTQ